MLNNTRIIKIEKSSDTYFLKNHSIPKKMLDALEKKWQRLLKEASTPKGRMDCKEMLQMIREKEPY